MSAIRSGSPVGRGPSSSDAAATGAPQDALLWALALGAGVALLAAVLLLGRPVGDVLFDGHRLHPFAAYAPGVIPKPAQFGRYALAVAFAFAAAAAVIVLPRTGLFERWRRSPLAKPLMLLAQLTLVAVAVLAWRGQNEGINVATPVQFHIGALAVALAIAVALVLAGWRGWLSWIGSPSGMRHRRWWMAAAAIVTALWLLPALYRSLNIGHSLAAVSYPLQFTFDDFMSVIDGRTPLVNYDAQYASLLPFATEPVFRVFGDSIGTFTTVMWVLSLLTFLCLERGLARVLRDERLAFLLFVPVLAASLIVLRHAGDERYFMANYYEVMPIRYAGPAVLLWCTLRQLDSARPRSPVALFALGGLVALNNTEFGLPALAGCALALASAQASGPGVAARLRRLGVQLALGLLAAVLAVTLFLVVRSGHLPQLSRLTRYEQIYAITGYNMVPTPNFGWHIVMYATFAVALVLGARRIAGRGAQAPLTGALIFGGTFGLGAGSYYMGRSLPEVLAALFPAWAFVVALLGALSLRALSDAACRRRLWPWRALPVAAVLVMLGLCATTVTQFPAPWTQLQRISRDTHSLAFNTAPAARFVRATARPGESVALLAALGHLVAHEAGTIDVSPYNHPDGMVTYEQVEDVLAALRSAHGVTLYTGAIVPEVSKLLMSRGFHVVAGDVPSGLTEWHGGAPAAPGA